MSSQYGTLEIGLYDNLQGTGACCQCETFARAYIYCPVFNHIVGDGNVKFDETGEDNRCELFSVSGGNNGKP